MPEAMNPSPSSSAFLSATRDSDAASIRPRNRRLHSAQGDAESSSVPATPSRSLSRGATPIPAAHIGSVTGKNDSGTPIVGSPVRSRSSGPRRGLLDASWAAGWSSVQELASSLLAGGGSTPTREQHGVRSRDGSRPRRHVSYHADHGNKTWGPAPPSEQVPGANDIGAGSLAEREAALKALRTASVLESHEGTNGVLDSMRRFKKRSSDEDLRGTSHDQETEAYLAYIHHVQKTDTYAGIVLRYRCQEDAFRKANGLWSRDNIQVRKWLAIPVDACEVKGRPCDPPATSSAKVDLLARTPDATDPFGRDEPSARDGFFASGHTPHQQQAAGDEDKPWTHVRWVSLDSCPHPVEVARVPRRALGYFPPRRKKSMHTVSSTLSSPRPSADLPNVTISDNAAAPPSIDSPRSSTTSRRPSSTTAQRRRPSSATSADDPRPAWMRRPGGVGSLGRHVRAPGPERDYFNAWTSKHLPGLNIDSLPSMSVMGSESARFGFASPRPTIDGDLDGGGGGAAAAMIVESPFEDGRDADAATTMGRSGGGMGLEMAAAAVETWLRGAFERAKQAGAPRTTTTTPIMMSPRGRRAGAGDVDADMAAGDLIELADASSDDGRQQQQQQQQQQHTTSVWDTGGLLRSLSPLGFGSGSGSGAGSGRSAAGMTAGLRGRGRTDMFGGNKKAD